MSCTVSHCREKYGTDLNKKAKTTGITRLFGEFSFAQGDFGAYNRASISNP